MKREQKDIQTIIEYTTEKAARNAYPQRIVSPPFSGSCCVVHMEQVGKIEWEQGFPYYYRRCRACGFTVKHFLPVEPVEVALRRRIETLQERHSGSRLHVPKRPREKPRQASPFARDLTSRVGRRGRPSG